MRNLPKRYWWGIGIWLALFAFYSLTAWQQLPWPVFSSPDETANYAFAQQDRLTSATIIPTDFLGAPRSVINTGTALLPASFVFFPHLIGFVGKVAGTFGMLMFGPMLAASAVLAWFGFVRRLFASRTAAWVSSILLATFPTFWFYASRGLWQNGVFTSLLILSIVATAWAWRARYFGSSALAGVLWGVTIAIRPSEISWLAPGVMVALLLAWRQVPWKQIGIAALCACVPVLCLFLFQLQTYNSPTTIGYRPDGAFAPAPIVRQLNSFQKVKNVFFPFGTKPVVAWEKFTTYGVEPLAYAVLPALLGMLWLGWRAPKTARHFIFASAVSGFFLILLYGNYNFVEFPAIRGPVLDFSYLRYWLPLVLLVSLGWAGIVGALHQPLARRFAYVLFGSVVVINVTLLLGDHTIGLALTSPRIRDAKAQSRWVVAQTPVNALIVAGSRDKIVFPRRHAIGFNGAVPSGLDLGDAPRQFPTYILLASPNQFTLLGALFPTLQSDEPVVGPDGITLVRLRPR